MDSIPTRNEEFSEFITVSKYFIFSILILLGTINSLFSLIALFIFAYIIVTCEENFSFGLMVFAVSLANIFKLSPNGTSFFTYVELLFVLCSILKRNLYFHKNDYSIFAFTVFLVLVQLGVSGTFNITATIKMLSHLLLLSYILRMDSFNIIHVFYCYICGVIYSSIISLFDGVFFNFSRYVAAKEMRLDGDMVSRFSGLYADPNYYSVNLIIAFCLLVILFTRKKIKLNVFITVAIIIAVFSGMTKSKSALLMLVFPVFVFIQISINKRKHFVVILSLIISAILIILVVNGNIPLFNQVISRLSKANDAKSLTTGRSVIWANYFKYFATHRILLICGNGINNVTMGGWAAHNTYIDSIYQMGIVGTSWYLSIIIRSLSCKSIVFLRHIDNYSVLIVIIVMYFFLSEIHYFDMIFHLIIGGLVLNYEEKDKDACY